METRETKLVWRDAQFLFETSGARPSLPPSFKTGTDNIANRVTSTNSAELALIEQKYEGSLINWEE